MALKGLDIFKLTPKTNCKDCGSPTCMAFSMKVAQGAASIEKCPHLSPEALAALSDATAPPMRTVEIGTRDNAHTLGGETVLFRHEKTLAHKNLFAVALCTAMTDAEIDAKLAEIAKIDYERIGERMYVELIYVNYRLEDGEARYAELVQKAMGLGRTLVLGCTDVSAAKAALALCGAGKPVLNGATDENYEQMNALAQQYGASLGVRADSLDALHELAAKLEALGNKNLLLDVGASSVKDAFRNAVEIRRAALLGGDRSFGYPSIVRISQLARGDMETQAMLAAMFVLKYGSILVLEGMRYSEALPLYGLRQNIYTDPQKPMKVAPGLYPLNGADENAVCAVTCDFALTYFIVSGEIERSGVPVNLCITDAGGYSVLTAWAAGKLSASSIAKFVQEFGVEQKIKNRTLILPGKIAVLKGEVEEKLPGWKVLVGPNDAIQFVKYLKEM